MNKKNNDDDWSGEGLTHNTNATKCIILTILYFMSPIPSKKRNVGSATSSSAMLVRRRSPPDAWIIGAIWATIGSTGWRDGACYPTRLPIAHSTVSALLQG
jgi:hypothetical protein